VIAPSFAFGLALTRIGCFLNGCCFGKPCSLPWGIQFPLDSPAGSTLPGVRLHPTQLYSSLFDGALVAVLLLAERKKRPDGFLFSLFFMLYGLFRFFIDFVRYYEPSVRFGALGMNLTFNQLIALSMVLVGFAMAMVLRARPAKQIS
jgi:phosphatidylglycerol:prolipoprotein diacylglycerol transferase